MSNREQGISAIEFPGNTAATVLSQSTRAGKVVRAASVVGALGQGHEHVAFAQVGLEQDVDGPLACLLARRQMGLGLGHLRRGRGTHPSGCRP